MSAHSVSLYVHIPFCKKKCAYCDFFSVPCASSLQKNQKKSTSAFSQSIIIPDFYIRALCNEALFYAQKYNIDSWKTIYVGGGTPSLLQPFQLVDLISGLKDVRPFAQNCEITVEMNPDDITEELLAGAKQCGVNRISVGIQSLSDEVLKACGRRCTRKTSLSALNLIAEKWKGNFSVDLISALPFDDQIQFKKTLSEVAGFNPQHISLYSLTLEEETPLGKAVFSGKIPYDYEKAEKLWIFGRNFLEKNGYKQYEVSNFAKSGFESVHNKTYWHLEDYIGIGAGATGTVYSPDFQKMELPGIRWTNTTDIDLYIEFWNGKDTMQTTFGRVQSIERLDFETQEFEFLMMGFRLLQGISGKRYFERFGKDLKSRLGTVNETGVFAEWQKKGLAKIVKKGDDEFYSLSADGLMLLNQFLCSLPDFFQTGFKSC